MDKLTRIERVRLSDKDAETLARLKSFGIKKSKFIREAIKEKLDKDCPQLISKPTGYCPF